MPHEETQLLNINEEESSAARISKSFLCMLGVFGVLLAASTITLGVLYFGTLETIKDDKIYRVKAGDAVLLSSQFSQLAGHRVGLITNPTAVVDSVHIIDWMFFTPNDVGMSLVALFGPEHGLRGNGVAGEEIENSVDERTGLPIYSLYGNVTAPTPEMLDDVTALVYDIQDVGCRFYTYISTMGLSMQAAAAAGIPFYVLDRPNPIGDIVSGWVLDPENASFIGEYPIPVQYGLTAGELALMIQGESYLDGLENLNLTIITMEGYKRGVLWTDTNLPWISPSPNMVDFPTAMLYPGTGFFEAFSLVTEGRGTLMPFKKIGAPWVNSTELIQQLESYGLPGVEFQATQFTPVNISDMSGNPKFFDQLCYGVEIKVVDASQMRPVDLGVYMVYTFYTIAPGNKSDLVDPDQLTLRAGTTKFYEALLDGTTPEKIIWEWQTVVQTYLTTRKPYLLYSQ